ncbi:MAG: GatB/YqeY domain-containing protein [Tetragenococcus koreensis]|uniref:GatB/YqeY domain-containing protein n=1 Tax=Tetragenococcus halophilus TaxID=51669 RepID=A0A3G5FK10_TETHA|nr:GatB/YqeY domain-containing protein [Tetragenococcus halophilus]MDN6138343.1 GatB/YqeY domain-containing protein [Tetragenococcus koreensis]AYW50687.1 GatB/YqeY domain-containing protein [Tetragenococcus halophilus]MCO8297543.1 GatB/YqeY domain-containing protein [Tetragenococcus halophilus]MDN6163062.1 GatB/YqeY domain-containing protein [Tetragenococcus halophilus]MDN6495913.1 GatB/YqeY domain-containing protein [Tetragenococcus koreensis]
MTLLTKLNDDMKAAMKGKDKKSLQVIRMLKASLQNEKINLGRDLTDEEELAIISREMKQRRDSLAEFEKVGRDDLAEKTKSEIAIVERYLPAQLTEDEIFQIVSQAIEQTGASSPKEFGKVMGVVMPKVKGKADGNQVNAIAKELLNQK